MNEENFENRIAFREKAERKWLNIDFKDLDNDDDLYKYFEFLYYQSPESKFCIVPICPNNYLLYLRYKITIRFLKCLFKTPTFPIYREIGISKSELNPFIESIMNGNALRYHKIKGNDIDYDINYYGLGLSWSWSYSRAFSYWNPNRDNDEGEIIHLFGLIENPYQINWYKTIRKKVYIWEDSIYEGYKKEDEIRLKPNIKILLKGFEIVKKNSEYSHLFQQPFTLEKRNITQYIPVNKYFDSRIEIK